MGDGGALGYEAFTTRVMASLLTARDEVPRPHARLADDLGWDSLAVLELIVAVEELAGSARPPDPPQLATMADAHRWYLRLHDLSGGGAAR